MTATFTPRAAGSDAWKRWLRDGSIVLLRGLPGVTMPLWALTALAVVAVQAWTSSSPGATLLTILGLFGLSSLLFGVQSVAFERLASGLGLVAAWQAAFAHALEHRRAYLVSFFVRSAWGFVGLCVLVGLAWAFPGKATAPPPIPQGLPWHVLVYVWFYPALFQRGGVLSARWWLRSVHGVPAELARLLDMEATAKNMKSYVITSMAVTVVGFATVGLLPVVLMIVGSWWVAVVGCAHRDVFEGGTGLKDVVRAPAAVPAAAVMARVAVR